MDLKSIIEKVGPVKDTITVNGSTYDIPYNQSVENYAHAGSMTNFNYPQMGRINDPFAYLLSTKFTGEYTDDYNGGKVDPIFEVTYKLPKNFVTNIGANGWIILNSIDYKDNKKYIGSGPHNIFTEDSVKAGEEFITYGFKAVPSCIRPKDSTEYYCAFDQDLMKFNEMFSYNYSEEEFNAFKESAAPYAHKCSEAMCYEAELGNITSDGVENFNKWLEEIDLYVSEDFNNLEKLAKLLKMTSFGWVTHSLKTLVEWIIASSLALMRTEGIKYGFN